MVYFVLCVAQEISCAHKVPKDHHLRKKHWINGLTRSKSMFLIIKCAWKVCGVCYKSNVAEIHFISLNFVLFNCDALCYVSVVVMYVFADDKCLALIFDQQWTRSLSSSRFVTLWKCDQSYHVTVLNMAASAYQRHIEFPMALLKLHYFTTSNKWKT